MMVKKIKNNQLDLNTIENKELSIQFSLDGFSFCVFNSDLQEFVVFAKYQFIDSTKTPEDLLKNIKQIFLADKDLQLDYKVVKVIHENNLSSFVPKILFNEDNIKDYIAFNNKIFNNDFFTFDSVANQEMNAVYIPYININNFLIDMFGSFVYKHSSSILVENLINRFSTNTGTSFFINVSKTHFEIVVSRFKKLLFFNTFTYHTKEDFIYYILFTFEQLKLNTESISLQFLGNIDTDSELYKIVYKYVRNVSFIVHKFDYKKYLMIEDKTIRENFTLFRY